MALRRLTLAGMMAAAAWISFVYLRVEVPLLFGLTGKVYIGYTFILLTGLLAGRWYGALSGAIGLTLADIMAGYVTSAVPPLPLFMPVLMDAYLESARLLGDALRSFNVHCAVGIVANEDRIREGVERSLMLVTALAPHIGYEKAAEIAKTAHRNHSSLRETALALGYVTAEDYDRYVVPADMVHPK